MFNVKKFVKECVEENILSEQEAERIAKADNDLLSPEELRIKYNNPLIGTGYPDWLDPTEHMKMCFATARDYFPQGFLWYYSIEDVASILYVWSLIRINTCSSYALLKCMLVRRCQNLVRDSYFHSQIYTNSYNNIMNITNSDEEREYLYLLKSSSLDEGDSDLVINISGIKNAKVRNILILCGYFIAELDCMFNMVVDLYKQSSPKMQKKLYKIYRTDPKLCDIIDLEYDSNVKERISFGAVLKSLGITDTNKSVREYLKTYLYDEGFLGV